MSYTCKAIAMLISCLALSLAAATQAQTADALADYVLLLPQVKARAPVINPRKGYVVEELKPCVFMVTEGAYESVFVTTGKGVVLFDAPPFFCSTYRASRG
jgi:hypothetical protein